MKEVTLNALAQELGLKAIGRGERTVSLAAAPGTASISSKTRTFP